MLRVLVGVTFSLSLVGASYAKEMTLSDQEQAVIGQICEIAARAANVPIATNAQIAGWCVQWDQKVKGTVPPVAPPTEPKKD